MPGRQPLPGRRPSSSARRRRHWRVRRATRDPKVTLRKLPPAGCACLECRRTPKRQRPDRRSTSGYRSRIFYTFFYSTG